VEAATKHVNMRRIDERLSMRAATKWANEQFKLAKWCDLYISCGLCANPPCLSTAYMRILRKPTPVPSTRRLPQTYKNRVLLLHTTQAWAKVGHQLWDSSKVFSNRCFRGWHNEHKHQTDAE